jgi:hypothetical protein
MREWELGESVARKGGRECGVRAQVVVFFVGSLSYSVPLCSVWLGTVVGPVQQIPYPEAASICP